MGSLEHGGVRLDVEDAGEGRALVLIHGSWTDRNTWNQVFGPLASRYRVIRYHRRGYGNSSSAGCSVPGHVADLRALLRALRLDRVTLIGSSLGGIIAIWASRDVPRDLIETVIVHEPPFLRLLARSASHRATWLPLSAALESTFDAIRAGDCRLAGQIYLDEVIARPGAWEHVPPDLQSEFMNHAPAFLSDATGLRDSDPDLDAMQALEDRLVITRGERSPVHLRLIADELCALLPRARKHVFAATGHVPHQSCPQAFVEFVREIVDAP